MSQRETSLGRNRKSLVSTLAFSYLKQNNNNFVNAKLKQSVNNTN